MLTKKRHFIALLLITFFFKLLTYSYLSYLTICGTPGIQLGKIAIAGGDTFSYFEPIEQYKNTGDYYFINLEKKKVYAGRMPYYGSIYYFFSTFLPKSTAYDAVALLQILFESLAIVLMSLLAYRYTQTKFGFWLCYALLILSLNGWATALLTESLSTSFLCLFFYFYALYIGNSNKNEVSLFKAGVWLSLACLLKPVMLVFFLPIGLEFIYQYKDKLGNFTTYKNIIKKTIIVSISFIVLIIPWTYRNYTIYQKFVPLQISTDADYGHPKSWHAMNKFIQAWGGSIIFWDSKSPAHYFTHEKSDYKFPKHAFAPTYNQKDLEDIRKNYTLLQKNRSEILDKKITKAFVKLTHEYQENQKIQYYLIAPLRLSQEFFLHSGSMYLPIHKNFPCYKSYQLLFKVGQTILYYFSLIFGIAGLLYMLIKHISFIEASIFILYLFLILIVIRAPEFRYYAILYPLMLLSTTVFIGFLTKTFDKKSS
ncbi:MAG: phospholipid carrier-dependent glycosyltransferase [Bacteroidetes bacterium]|nr:MAG: phospholipid carrier-dependent glycosyltransferase [Bacteroidota bacterium]